MFDQKDKIILVMELIQESDKKTNKLEEDQKMEFHYNFYSKTHYILGMKIEQEYLYNEYLLEELKNLKEYLNSENRDF